MGDEIETVVDTSVDSEGESDTTSTDDAVDTSTDDTTAEDGAEAEGGEDEEDEEDEEPPVRKPRSNADWVKLRQERKQKRDQYKGSQGEEGDESEDDDLSEEDKKAIDRHLEKRLQPILEKERAQETKGAIAEFVAANPDFKKYAAKVEKWAGNPSWENIPIDRIFYAAAGKDLLKLGAAKKAAADIKARNARTAQGGTAQAGGSKKGVWEMSDEEFAKEVAAVARGN